MNPEARLKPLFGLSPKYWLAGIYSILLLTGFLALTLGAGLLRPGTMVTVQSIPEGASVSWGGHNWGITPLTVFFPEGTGTLRVGKLGFVPWVHRFDSGNNLIMSLFWPRMASFNLRLPSRSGDSVQRAALFELGRWSLAAPYGLRRPFPPLFTALASDLSATGLSEGKIKDFLLQLRPLVADSQMYLDYGRALGLWKDTPPQGLEPQAKLWEPVLNQGQTTTDRLVFWLVANQDYAGRTKILDSGSPDFQARREAWQKANLTLPDETVKAPDSVLVAGTTFVGIASCWYFWGQTTSPPTIPVAPPYRLPVKAHTPTFWMAKSPVLQGDFEAFLVQNPEWERKEALDRGLADEGYLADWSGSKPPAPSQPVTRVSWNSAQAYVSWLNRSEKAPTGFHFTLVKEQQWEAAVRQDGFLWTPRAGTWELTSSPFGVADPLVWGENPVPPPVLPSYAYTLKGGSELWSRAAAPAVSTSPIVTFRLGLEKNTQEANP
jgi:hypothetical protein